jgi:hypothetical protein
MASFSHQHSNLVRLLLVPVLILLACRSFGGPPAGESPDGELNIEQDLVFGPGSFIYGSPRAGLAGLSSYTASLTLTFEGTRDGNAFSWLRSYTLLATNAPHARRWMIEDTRDGAAAAPMFLAELDGAQYSRRGQEACSVTEIPAENPLSDRMELAEFLSPVIGAEEGGTDRVNEIAAARYTFDQRALGEQGLAESTGEMWIASDGGFIVRYLLTTTGTGEYFGEGIEGTLFTAYELTAPNQPVTIELPEDCPPGMVDAPLMPHAEEVLKAPGLLTYATSADLPEAAAFYQERIPGLGWESSGDSLVTETEAFLNFERGDRHMTIILGVEEGRTTVNISVTRKR